MIRITFFLFLLFNFNSYSYSETIRDVKLIGNSRISLDTVKAKIEFVKNKDYSLQELNKLQKKIYETGFFKSVEIETKDNLLVITVKENPLIDFFYIDGENREKFKEALLDQLKLGPNKIFSDYALLEDIEKIKTIYKSSGYYNIEIKPEISLRKDNQINLVLNIKKNNQTKINRIFFIGEKYFKNSDLLNQVSSSEDGWYKLSNNTILNEERIFFDKSILKSFYLDEGFYDVQIVSSNIKFKNDNLADIIFSINAGDKYKFNKVIFKEKEKLLNEIDLKNLNKILNVDINKSYYSLKKIRKIKSQLQNYLTENNYSNINFSLNEKKFSDKKLIDIEFRFFKSDSTIINNILVKGNSLTNENVIRRNLFFSEGDLYSEQKKDKSIDKLNATRIFKSVKIEKINIDNSKTDLIISVEEQPTGSIYGGVGVTSNEASINFGLTENNFLGDGNKLNTTLVLGTQTLTYDITYINPDYNYSDRLLKVRAYAIKTKYDNTGYESSKIGNELSTNYEIFQTINFTTGIGVDYDDVSSNTLPRLTGKYFTTKGFYGFSKDTRNRLFNTTEGYRAGFIQTLATPPSDITYLKNEIYNNFYYPLHKDYTLNSKMGLSSINSLNNKDIKLSDRLFLPQTYVRGFENKAIGPIENGDHVGGNYASYLNIATTFPNPLPEKLNATSIFFIDAGNVWGVDYDSSFDKNKIRTSIGVGLDWLSPLGPINFTLANPISKTDTDKAQKFSFQIGSTF